MARLQLYVQYLATVLFIAFFTQTVHAAKQKKPWLIIVFAAADNNLRDYIAKNLRQMSVWGSSDYFTIVVHVDIRLMGQKKTSRRYIVEKNNPQIIEVFENQAITYI